MRTDVSRSLTNSPQFAGVSAGSNADVRSLSPAEVAIASILAAGLWALQTRSWRRPEFSGPQVLGAIAARAVSRPVKLVLRREQRSEEHTSELQSPCNLVCRLLLEKKKKITIYIMYFKTKTKKNI